MKRLLLIAALLFCAVAALGQVPSQGAAIAPVDTGGCGSTYGTACTGANANYWNTNPGDTCAESPILTSGTYSGFAVLFCIGDYSATFYKIDYSTTPPTPTLISQQWTMAWLNTNTSSGLPPQPCVTDSVPGCVVEQHMVYDPFINPTANPPGGFALATKNDSKCAVLAVSTTADPTGSWLHWTATGQFCGDNTPTISFSSNALVLSQVDATPLSGVYYIWTNVSPSLHEANLYSTIPSPDVTFDHTSSTVPGELGQPLIDYTVGKATTDPDIWISNCRTVTYPCGGSTSLTNVVIDEINITSASTATLTQDVLTTSLTLGVPSTTDQPNNVVFNNSNAFYEQDGVELSNHQGYTRRSVGAFGITSYTLDIDFTTPASPAIVNGWAVGGSVAGDVGIESHTADAHGNIIENGMLTSKSLAMVPYAAWIPTSASSPYIISGTISASGGGCPSTSCVKDTFPSATVASVSVTIGSFTGTIQAQNSGSGSLTCTPVLGGSGVTSFTAAGTYTCVATGLSGVQFVASALSVGTPSVKIIPQFGPFYQNAAVSASTISTAGTTCTPSTNCASLTVPSGVTQVMAMVASPTGFVGTLQFEGNLGAITATLAGSSGASPTTATSMVGSDTNCTGFNPCAWTFPIGSNTTIDVRASALTSGTPAITFETVAANSRANNTVSTCVGGAGPSGDQEMNGVFQPARPGTADPYRMWAFPAYGGTRLDCSYTYEAVQFGIAVPATGSNIVTSPSSASISGGTQAFTSVATYIDGLSDGGPQCTWASSNPSIATVNPSTGVATFVSAPGSTNITQECSGVVSSPVSVLTTTSGSGTYYFPSH